MCIGAAVSFGQCCASQGRFRVATGCDSSSMDSSAATLMSSLDAAELQLGVGSPNEPWTRAN
eukprot:351309-Chlamydomonas_euryale.AAC.10